MSRPTGRKGSRFKQFKERVPADLLHRIAGRTLVVPVGETSATVHLSAKTKVVQFSLRTAEPNEVRVRKSIASARVESFWAALRTGATRLSQRQVVAIAGEIYRSIVQTFEDNPGDPTRWEWTAGFYEHALLDFLDTNAVDSSEGTGLPLIDRKLAEHGLVVDRDSIERLFMEVRRALMEAAQRLQAVAEGDFRPDANVGRFPDFANNAPGAAQPETLTGLCESWWKEAEATGTAHSTFTNYRGVIKALVRILGHDDALKVTPKEIVRFKDVRLTEVSARTVKDGDLAALKTIFGWAKINQRLPSNPAEGITIKRVKVVKLRNSFFSKDEILTIIKAANAVEVGPQTSRQSLANRWVPWVLAYTGARVGEIVQLRRQDLHWVDDHWEIELTPAANTVKGGKFRRVPLHPHLVEMGFVAMVQAQPDGHIFANARRTKGPVRGSVKGVANRLRDFIRLHVSDDGVDPNHGWRHLFVTTCREVGVSEELRGMITGHTGRTVAAREYGGPAGLYREICKLPRFEV